MMLPRYHCKRCDHTWFPRKEGEPTICPKCKSPYWRTRRKKKGKHEKLTDYQRGYIESAIDFEGSLSIRKCKNNLFSHGYEIVPLGNISNTNIDLLKKVKDIMGEGSIVLHQRHDENKNWKPSYRYNFTRAGLRWLLPEIRLIEKEKQRLLVIRALDIIKRGGKYYRSKKMPDETYEKLCKMVDTIRTYNNRGLNANWNKQRLKDLKETNEHAR